MQTARGRHSKNEPGDSLFISPQVSFNVNVSGPDGAREPARRHGTVRGVREPSLVDEAPRSATVIAHTRGELACIHRQPFSNGSPKVRRWRWR